MVMSSKFFDFPAVVNEHAARIVAGTVAVAIVAAFAARQPWVVALLAAGFLARVASGPRFSVLARVAMAAARSLGEPKLVAGSPKRFAQGIGAVCTLGASALFLAGLPAPAWGLALVVAACAALEAVFAFCLGCTIYGQLQRLGLVSASVCVDCAPRSSS